MVGKNANEDIAVQFWLDEAGLISLVEIDSRISFMKLGAGGRNAVREAWQPSLWLSPETQHA